VANLYWVTIIRELSTCPIAFLPDRASLSNKAF